MKIYILKRKKQLLWKIGITNSMRRRKREIEVSSGFKVSVWACLTLPWAAKLERFGHKLYRAKNKPQKGSGGTEWFKLFFPFRFFVLVVGVWLGTWGLGLGMVALSCLGLLSLVQ